MESECQQVSPSQEDSSQYSCRSKNALVWVVSARSLIHNSPSSFTNLFTTGIIVTFILYRVFSSLARSKFLSLFLLSFGPLRRQSSLFSRLSLFFLVFWPGLGNMFASENPSEFYTSHSIGRILVSAYTIWYYNQNSISCTIPNGSPFPPSRVYYCALFRFVSCIRLFYD